MWGDELKEDDSIVSTTIESSSFIKHLNNDSSLIFEKIADKEL